MKIIKNIVTTLGWIVGIFGSLSSLTGKTISQVLDSNNTKQLFDNIADINFLEYLTVAYPYLLLLTMLTVFFFNKNRIYFLFKSYNPFVIIKILEGIHEFQHVYIDNMRMYKGNENKDGISEIGNLIEEIRKIFSYIDKDISINFKVFLNDNKNVIKATEKSVLRTSLITLVRARSSKEIELKRQRKNNEIYKVVPNVTAEDLYKQPSGCIQKKCNSAFNDVVGPNQHYFISNDLLTDEKKEKYFNSGENWKEYYSSIAIFLVAPRQVDACGTVGNPYALLIADSPQKYVFINKIVIVALMGYLSHRMFSFMRNTVAKL